MQQRRLGRIDHASSVLIYGAAALSDVDQEVADRSIQLALDAGINHFDVAAGYGDAELRLGPWMPRIRDQVFLATKTGERAADAAWAQINHSLERLQTDHLDLIQLHAVGDVDELDLVTRSGGALEAAVRHREALRRFPFDTVLSPLNYVLSLDPVYMGDYEELVGEVRAQGAGLMIIKTVSRRNWPDDARPYTTWYEPFDDQERITAAVVWVLSHEEVTGIATPGDVRLLPLVIEAEKQVGTMPVADAEEVLAAAADYSSPFINIPF